MGNEKGSKTSIEKWAKAAIEDFNKSIVRDKDKNFIDNYKWRGECYLKLGDHEAAVNDFKEYLKLGEKKLNEKAKAEYEEKIRYYENILDNNLTYNLKKSLNEFKTVVSQNHLLQALLIVMVLDFLMILGCGVRERNLTAELVAGGLGKTGIILLVLIVVNALNESLTEFNFLPWVMSAILVYELIFVLNKTERLGIPVPEWLKNIVQKIIDFIERIFGGARR